VLRCSSEFADQNEKQLKHSNHGTITVKYNDCHNLFLLLVSNSALEHMFLFIRVHLPASRTPADISFILADIAQQ